jgi:hypothetical protein
MCAVFTSQIMGSQASRLRNVLHTREEGLEALERTGQQIIEKSRSMKGPVSSNCLEKAWPM